MRTLLCYAEGKEGEWEAVCLDLDIAVQGSSFSEVYQALNDAVESYIEDALAESPANQARLLNRAAPIQVRLGCTLRILWQALRRRKNDSTNAQFTVPCAA